jgi:hypothetical protein
MGQIKVRSSWTSQSRLAVLADLKLQIEGRDFGIARQDGPKRRMGARPALAVCFKMKSAGPFQFRGGQVQRKFRA